VDSLSWELPVASYCDLTLFVPGDRFVGERDLAGVSADDRLFVLDAS
jgi:hypothetical protein